MGKRREKEIYSDAVSEHLVESWDSEIVVSTFCTAFALHIYQQEQEA